MSSTTSSPNASSPIPSLSPSWEWAEYYLLALREVDETRRPQRLAQAEAAIIRRMQSIFFMTECASEREAIDLAWRCLSALRAHERSDSTPPPSAKPPLAA